MVGDSNQGLNPDGIDQELTDLGDDTLNEILIELVKMRNSQEQTVKKNQSKKWVHRPI